MFPVSNVNNIVLRNINIVKKNKRSFCIIFLYVFFPYAPFYYVISDWSGFQKKISKDSLIKFCGIGLYYKKTTLFLFLYLFIYLFIFWYVKHNKTLSSLLPWQRKRSSIVIFFFIFPLFFFFFYFLLQAF